MKTAFQKLVRGISAGFFKKMLFGQAEKNGRGSFEPAPAYWALVPIKPDRIAVSKKDRPGE